MTTLRDVLTFIKDCSEPDLRTIIDIVRMKQQQNTFKKAAAFNYGDTVSFLDKKGRRVTGKVTKINAKSIAVEVPSQFGIGTVKWRVHPSLLAKVEPKPEPTKEDDSLRNRLRAAEELARRGATQGERDAARAAADRLRARMNVAA